MPVYNAEKYLAQAIESILGQTFTDFEFLIFNDGSKDRSSEIVRNYSDFRIKFYDQTHNTGYVKHLNKGIELAQGKYIARMDADDIADATRLTKQVELMESRPEIGLCGSWYDVIDSPQQFTFAEDHEGICNQMLLSNPICHPVVMIRKSILLEGGFRYKEEYMPAEDYFLWTELSEVTNLHNLPEFLLHYRMHQGQISAQKRALQNYNIGRSKFHMACVQSKGLAAQENQYLNSLLFNKSAYVTTSDLLYAGRLFQKMLHANGGRVLKTPNLASYLNSLWKELYARLKTYSWKGALLLTQPQAKLLSLRQRIFYVVKCILGKKTGISLLKGYLFELQLSREKKVAKIQHEFLLYKLGKRADIKPSLKLGKHSDMTLSDKNTEVIFGEHVEFRDFCRVLVYPHARLLVGDHVFFNHHCSLNCLGTIEISANTILGEGVKIYDHNHLYQTENGKLDVKRNEFSIGKVRIGKNCWIGSNVTILKGVEIGDNVIIGANNLIYKSIPSNSVVKAVSNVQITHPLPE